MSSGVRGPSKRSRAQEQGQGQHERDESALPGGLLVARVRRWTAPGRSEMLPMVSLFSDDSVADARRKLAEALDVPDPSHLCMWTVRDLTRCDDASRSQAAWSLVNSVYTALSAEEARRVTYERLRAAYVALTGQSPMREGNNVQMKKKKHHHLSRQQAYDLVTGASWGGVRRVVEPVGAHLTDARMRARALLLQGGGGADPFSPEAPSPPTPDPGLVPSDAGGGGAPRQYAVALDSEALLLEQLLPPSPSAVLEVATLQDVSRHVARAAGIAPSDPLPPQLAAGHVGKFFPLHAFRAHLNAPFADASSVAAAARAVLAARKRVPDNPSKSRPSCTFALQRVWLPLPPPPPLLPTPSVEAGVSAGRDVLYELFAAFSVSAAAPMATFFDGTEALHKLWNGDGLATVVPHALLRRWVAPAVALSRPKQPSLQLHVAVPSERADKQQLATLKVLSDFTAAVHAGGFSPDERSADGMRRDVEAVCAAVGQLALEPLREHLRLLDVPFTLPQATPELVSRMFGTGSSGCFLSPPPPTPGRMTFSLSLSSGARAPPSPAQLQAVVSHRMPHLLTLVAAFSDGRTVLSYRRASGASSMQRASRLVRLMRGRPEAAVVSELVRTFGMAPDAADAFYSSHAAEDEAGGNNNKLLPLRIDTVPVIDLSRASGLGFDGVVHNVSDVRYMHRLCRLLEEAVAPQPQQPQQPQTPPKQHQQRSTLQHHQAAASALPDGDRDRGGDEDGDEDDIDALVADDVAEHGEQEQEQEPLAGDEVPLNYLLNMLHRADRPLFKFKGTGYANDCARNNMRQPVVITPQELARIDAEFPGAHSGALVGYGSSPDLAARNVYICPRVWCPRSRVALSAEQFNKLGRRCPYPDVDEQPLEFDNGYFGGRDRYVGMLDGSKHPSGLCMPCCFQKPGQRVDKCGASVVLSAAANGSKKVSAAISDQTAAGSHGSKYVRGDVPGVVEDSRYAVLPRPLSDALGSKRCGNRDDGSGQLTARSDCFVRRGVRANTFLDCVAYALDNPAVPDAGALVAAVRNNLCASDFLTLDGGHVSRVFMQGIEPSELLADADTCARFLAWFGGPSAAPYVSRFSLQPLLSNVMRMTKGDGAGDKRGKGKGKGNLSTDPPPEVLREALVWAALQRYLEWLPTAFADDGSSTTGITHRDGGLLDLVSRPLPWLNPHRVNVLLFERDDAEGGDITVSCPGRRADPRAAWRLDDPVVLLLRSIRHYQAVVHVRVSGRAGLVQMLRLYPGAHEQLSSIVRGYLSSCSEASTASTADRVGRVLSAMRASRDPARAQVLDYAFRLTGLVSHGGVYVPLDPRGADGLTVLTGASGAGLGMMYVSDVASQATPADAGDAPAVTRLLAKIADLAGEPGLRVVGGAASSSNAGRRGKPRHLTLANGGVVPLAGFLAAQATGGERGGGWETTYLRHLHAFVHAAPSSDRRTQVMSRLQRAQDAQWNLRARIVRRIWSDTELMAQLRVLRSPFNPLPQDARRELVRALATQAASSPRTGALSASEHDWQVLVDTLLFAPAPLSLRHTARATATHAAGGHVVAPSPSDALLFNDADVVSGALDAMLAAAYGDKVQLQQRPQQQQQQGQQPQQQQPQQPSFFLSSGRRLSGLETAGQQQLPVSVKTLKALLQANKKRDTSSSSRSTTRATFLVPNVDVYAVVHLAHRILFSDAPAPLAHAEAAVADALVAAATVRGGGGGGGKLPNDGTLGRVAKQRPGSMKALLQAVALRGEGRQSYVTSSFEIDALSTFLRVPVVVLPSQSPAFKAASKAAGSSIKSSTSKSSRSMKQQQQGNRLQQPGTVHLMVRADGTGHDLVMWPSPELPGHGHLLLLPSSTLPLSGSKH